MTPVQSELNIHLMGDLTGVKLINEPLTSLTNLIYNDYECMILFIILPFKCGFIVLKNAYLYEKLHCCNASCHGVTCFCLKCCVTSVITLFMT